MTSDKPNGLIAIDILSGFPRTKRGNVYLLVITDYGTRFAMVIPIKDKTPERIMASFNRIS